MPIKDGIPQWNAHSYQYVTQKPRCRQETLLRGQFWQYGKMIESSLIGKNNKICMASIPNESIISDYRIRR